MKNLFDLTGKVAVVTGASSGLGVDAAQAYGFYGASVALLARRTDKLERTAELVRAQGAKALPLTCDVSDEGNVSQAIAKVMAEFGRIDILLNNAGMLVRGGVDDLELEDWNRIVGTNLTGVYLMCKHVIPHMKSQGGGKVVNIASINAVQSDKAVRLARHAYNATKAGVCGLTVGMAATYGVDNITVNSIGPGLFESEITENSLFKNPAYMQTFCDTDPMSRPGDRGELNGTIIYLSSDASSYVTGQYIIVDGGYAVV
jgi:gluconate 5-dehydrogenase